MKRSLLSTTIAAALIGLSGCSTNIQPVAPADIFINSLDTKTIANEVVRLCDEKNLVLREESERSIVCTANAGMMANLFFGTPSGSGVSHNAGFTIIPYKDVKQTKLSGRAWLENQNAYGGTRKDSLDHNPHYNEDLKTFIKIVKERVEN